MSVSAKCLISSRFASASDNTEYTSPAGTRAIVDKFTVTNTDSASQTLTVNLVPSGGSVATSNVIVSARAVAAGATADLTELQNQILNAGDFLSAKASSASKLVIRSSGREVV